MSNTLRTSIKKLTGAVAITCMLPLAAETTATSMSEIHDMKGELISAGSILQAQVWSEHNDYAGNVSKLVLNEQQDALQYILYEGPNPWDNMAYESGFITFDNSDFEYGSVNLVEVRYEVPEDSMAPDELRLTKSQAQGRLISNLIGSEVTFTDNQTRVVEDILFNIDSGEIAYFLVDMDPNAMFATERRAIPADSVSINDSGHVMAALNLQSLQ